MRSLVAAPILVLLLAFTLNAQQHTTNQWVKFTSDSGRFSAQFPELPTEQTETTQTDHGPYTTHMYVAKSGTKVYVIGWVDYDESFNFRPLNELDANRDNFIQGTKATLLTSHNLVLSGFQSLEFTAETDNSSYRSRVMIVGRRPYQLVVRTDKGVEDTESTTRFLNSFVVKP